MSGQRSPWYEQLARIPALKRLVHRYRKHRSRNPHPPKEGWEFGPPDFVGIGTQRAGTTWWYRAITRHPDVVPRKPKELHFFGEIYGPKNASDEVLQSYTTRFARPPGKIVGEWTPEYIMLPWVAEALVQVAPDAKILMLVRDPVERYRSGLTFVANWGEREATDEGLRSWAFGYGRYASQLELFLQHFSRDQILVLQFERCVADPAVELRRTFDALGVDPSFVPSDLERPRNTTKGEKVDVVEDRSELVARYEPEVVRLKELVPDIDISLWPNFTHLDQ